MPLGVVHRSPRACKVFLTDTHALLVVGGIYYSLMRAVIVMARRQGLSISNTAALVGCSRSSSDLQQSRGDWGWTIFVSLGLINSFVLMFSFVSLDFGFKLKSHPFVHFCFVSFDWIWFNGTSFCSLRFRFSLFRSVWFDLGYLFRCLVLFFCFLVWFCYIRLFVFYYILLDLTSFVWLDFAWSISFRLKILSLGWIWAFVFVFDLNVLVCFSDTPPPLFLFICASFCYYICY